jgi:release factor glutamine methyltransferase
VRLARAIPVQQARRALGAAFGSAGLDTPDLDARVLVAHALGLDHAGLVAAGGRALDDTEAARISSLADRRLAGEPVARILGTREFWGLPLTVTPAVLVPRPETETVVELALSLIEDRARPLRIADLGTGSGAILLALLHELPNAFGIGTDIAPGALEVARRNAMRLGLADRARFAACDYGAALAGPFDLVLSNPPYIATSVIATLAPEVRDHDPSCALDGGADGLAAYRTLAADAARLAGAGHLVVEIGAGQERDVEFLLTQKGLALAAMRHDLSGIARALAVRF